MTAADTARDFIRATLDGDFKAAQPLLLNESENLQLFDSYKEFYGHWQAEKKAAYRDASYTINSFTESNDSVSVINYSNSYMNKPTNIRLVRRNDTWFVDFRNTTGDSTRTP